MITASHKNVKFTMRMEDRCVAAVASSPSMTQPRTAEERVSTKRPIRFSFVTITALSFAALLAGCVSDSELADRPKVLVGMSRDELRFCFGKPSRIESTASGGEDWYYSFATGSLPQVEASSSVEPSGARTDSVSVSISDTKTRQQCPIHLSSNGRVIEPIPAGTIVGK